MMQEGLESQSHLINLRFHAGPDFWMAASNSGVNSSAPSPLALSYGA